jgi:inner membrane protein
LDNVTHSLFALTIARANAARTVPGAAAALLVASNAPDIDIIAAFTGGAGAYLDAHRGATHGPLGAAGLGLGVGSLVWALVGLRRRGPHGLQVWARLVAISCAAALLHIVMDLPTVYGTRLLSPFSDRWFSYDWLPIIDLHLWVALATGLAARAVRPSASSRILAAVLAVMAANYVLRAAAHDRAMTVAGHPSPVFRVSSWSSQPDGKLRPCPDAAGSGARASCRAIAIPTFLSPFEWRVIWSHDGHYEVADLNLLEPASIGRRVRVSVERGAWTERAAQGAVARTFLGFARVSSARVEAGATGGARVVFRDLRFARGPIDRLETAPSAFTMTSVLDARGDIVSERLRD